MKLMDRALVSAWTGHPHLRIIDNSTDFAEKLNRVIREISHFLGEPIYYEIERKFLIEYPDINMLESMPDCQKVEIIQTYLVSSDPEAEVRIRQRGKDGHYIYTKTEKRKVKGESASAAKRIEVESRLNRAEYLTLLMEADTNLRQIRKTRYCLVHDRQYHEIDIYPFWNNQAILEVELTDENAPISIPDFIKVIREVTEEDAYKNYSLAKEIPAE
jgi:CYTH domain-containing protein